MKKFSDFQDKRCFLKEYPFLMYFPNAKLGLNMSNAYFYIFIQEKHEIVINMCF